MSNIGFITPDLQRLQRLPRGGALGLFRFAELAPLTGVNGLVDWRILGQLSRLVIDGFVTGEPDESLLFPLAGRLPHNNLLLLGLGQRERFNEHVFRRAVSRLFDHLDKLDDDVSKLTVSLPGRAEGVCQAADAIDWLLPLAEQRGNNRQLTLIEPTAAQKDMQPAIERWRLKRDVS
ncbi:MAG: hypothetical protein JRF63_16355 [Deltaproteobacteria bacterium]|nr:hypothetical protein [Deltaproteobacteria bacterium]